MRFRIRASNDLPSQIIPKEGLLKSKSKIFRKDKEISLVLEKKIQAEFPEIL